MKRADIGLEVDVGAFGFLPLNVGRHFNRLEKHGGDPHAVDFE